MGMRESQVLRRVELPAGMPLILVGCRTAAVQVVATATLGALVAGGGLGRYIVDGFALRGDEGTARLVAGAILVALLAIVTERTFTLVERRVHARRRARPGCPGGGAAGGLRAVGAGAPRRPGGRPGGPAGPRRPRAQSPTC